MKTCEPGDIRGGGGGVVKGAQSTVYWKPLFYKMVSKVWYATLTTLYLDTDTLRHLSHTLLHYVAVRLLLLLECELAHVPSVEQVL